MKKLFFISYIISLFSTSFSCVSTKRSNMEFIDFSHFSDEIEITAVNLPTFMIKPFMVKILKRDKESKEVIALVKSIKKSENFKDRKSKRNNSKMLLQIIKQNITLKN